MTRRARLYGSQLGLDAGRVAQRLAGRRCVASGLALLAAFSTEAEGQRRVVPLDSLTWGARRSSEVFGTLPSVVELPNGKVLVNDGRSRRVLLLDPSLARQRTVIDSAATGETSQAYGTTPTPLMTFAGDSLLFADAASRSLVVIDPEGRVVKVVAAPRTSDFSSLIGGRAYGDGTALIYRAPTQRPVSTGSDLLAERAFMASAPDTAPLVRARFEDGRVDTITWIRTRARRRVDTSTVAGRGVVTIAVIPVATVDDWTVLADGTIAVVRGNDYHVDFYDRVGQVRSAPRVDFPWERLADSTKRRLIDSARIAREATGSPTAGVVDLEAGVSRIRIRPGVGGVAAGSVAPLTRFVDADLAELPDYVPPVRPNAMLADREGNLWVAPTRSLHSRRGEVVYDVIDRDGTLVRRVRIPEQGVIVGFGRDRRVYIGRRVADGWQLQLGTP